jgi:hypothetical protein
MDTVSKKIIASSYLPVHFLPQDTAGGGAISPPTLAGVPPRRLGSLHHAWQPNSWNGNA